MGGYTATLGLRHQHVAQCCRNIQSFFSKCLCIQRVCLGFKRFHRNIDKNICNIMIWRIHYFITKLKTKIDVIPRGPFNSLIISITLQSQYIRAYRAVSSIIVSSIIVNLFNVVLQSHTVITLVYSIKSTLTQRLWQWK